MELRAAACPKCGRSNPKEVVGAVCRDPKRCEAARAFVAAVKEKEHADRR